MSFDHYKTIPALAEYIDRVGAEQLNFRRFMVKEHKGAYYTERALIKISGAGEISCTDDRFAPTDEEAAKIKAALSVIEFPKAIGASEAELAAFKSERGEDGVYAFWDRRSNTVTMVQKRILVDGEKKYIPWTYYSDGKWRATEPDGPLPFWKPREPRSTRIMVHEGAKAAAFCDFLTNSPGMKKERSAHPWAEELAQYEHWGMIGGALAPHRADYAELLAVKPIETVYVCDNDWPGKSALREVSRCYGRSLKGVIFDRRWPAGWDMADPMPETVGVFRSPTRRYIGPSLADLMVPATFATEQVKGEGRGRPAVVMRREFREEWFHCIRPEVYIHRDWPNKLWSSTEFNTLVRPCSHVDDTARLLKQDNVSKGEILKYDPSKREGIYGSGDDGKFINTHVPSPIKPEPGDVRPWIEYLEHLFPVEGDRVEVMRWCATLIARPEIKMLYGMLLVSETQGVGKTTIGEKVLAPLVGHGNVSYPSESDIVDSPFNYWSAHKRLAIVNEIYAGHSAKAYNKLKSIITDKYISVSQKYQPNYQVENWVHVLACSNSLRAIQISSDDRRWFVPKVTERKRDQPYWDEFNRWLLDDGGLAKISHWAGEWIEAHGPVLRGMASPPSAAKQEMVEEGMSRGMIEVMHLLDRLRRDFEAEAVVFTDTQLVQFIQDAIYEGRHNDRLEKPLTLRKLAKQKGWHVGEARVYLGPGKHGRIISNDPDTARSDPESVRSNGVKVIDFSTLPRDL